MIGTAIILFSGSSLVAKGWNRSAAERAFEEAKRLHNTMRENSPRNLTRERYLQCIRAYQQVYLRDPHYGASDDAAFEAGKLYQEMGEVFGDPDYYRLAIRLFTFLVDSYPISSNCPDALLRMGDLHAGPLGDEILARAAYERLRSQYKSSAAAAKAPSSRVFLQESRSLPPPTAPSPKDMSSSRPSDQGLISSVHGIRHWTTRDYTRVIIDLDNETRYQKTRLGNPDRIYFDIYSAKLTTDLVNKTFAVGDQFLRQVRVGQNKLDVVRVVLDFAGISDYSVFELHDPFRIVIDIHGMGPAAEVKRRGSPRDSEQKQEIAGARKTPSPAPSIVLQSSSPIMGAKSQHVPSGERTKTESVPNPVSVPDEVTPVVREIGSAVEGKSTKATSEAPDKRAEPKEERTAAAEPAASPDLPTLRAATPTSMGDRTMTRTLGLKIGRIVLDPGHGGHDTGTIGIGGMQEKNLVLQVARQLRRLLEDRLGAEVVLTRTDDTFIPLEERTAIANQHQADLFISIHANSSRSRAASGVETYYLNFARTSEAREVAARENASTIRNIRDLQDLVRKIAQEDKSTESRELAALLQKKLYTGARKVYPTARDRGVRSAPFVVLIGANMPSVLAEVGFISNPKDERLLRKEDNRSRLAEALFAGIEVYMKTLGSDVALNR